MHYGGNFTSIMELHRSMVLIMGVASVGGGRLRIFFEFQSVIFLNNFDYIPSEV